MTYDNLITAALILSVVCCIPFNCLAHYIRRGRMHWTHEEGFHHIN